MSTLLTIYTLWQREVVRFYRQPSRVIGALGSPLLFWMLIGSGIGSSFRTPYAGYGRNYLEYFFPGTLLMIILFTAIFSTISIIEDRREGFLQAVLVAPAPRWSLALGKILGGATLAWIQALLLLAIGYAMGLPVTEGSFVVSMIVIFMSAVTLTGLGFLIAWNMNSIQGFHAIMNLFLLPLWLLSGALFPSEGARGWLQILMKINPLTYELAMLRRSLAGDLFKGSHLPGWGISILVTLVFGAVMLLLCARTVQEHRGKQLV